MSFSVDRSKIGLHDKKGYPSIFPISCFCFHPLSRLSFNHIYFRRLDKYRETGILDAYIVRDSDTLFNTISYKASSLYCEKKYS